MVTRRIPGLRAVDVEIVSHELGPWIIYIYKYMYV